MRFACNISTMFNDMDLLDRFNEAKAFGFNTVEAQWVDEYTIEDLNAARNAAEVKVALINSPKRGNIWRYETPPVGVACVPHYEWDFSQTIIQASKYCDFLQCPKLNIMAGVIPEDATFEECEEIYLQNLSTAAETLELYNLVGVIEPICNEVLPNYFLNSFEQAIEYIDELGLNNIKLLLDVFQLYKIEGHVEELIRYLRYAAHVQVSQSPLRNEPFLNGEIDYENVFQVLETNGYVGDVGLEYTPSAETPDFEWFKRFEH